MSIVDVIILILLLIGAYRGFRRGSIRSAISFVGSLLVFIIAYYLKNPISILLYENLPFRNFGGILHNITTLNILYYEGIAYIICLTILGIIFKILIKLSGIVDKIINMTGVLTLPNKLIGLILNTLRYYIYIYIIVFILSIIPMSQSYISDSLISTNMLSKTPLLSYITDDVYGSVKEIYDICLKYERDSDKDKANQESLDTLLKYKVISPESAKKLKNKKKLNFKGASKIIEKYEGEKK